MDLEIFCYGSKLVAKWAEVVQLLQKFVPRSSIGFFRNECTRSTPFYLILTFWCIRTIWVHSGLFGCLTKLDAKHAELVQKFVPRSRVGIFHNKHTRSTPCVPKLTFWCVGTIWGHSGPFGCLTKLGAKRAELVQKLVPRSRVEIFQKNAPNPPHWILN